MALVVSLLLSALFTAAALRLPDHRWLAWISFLPLFVVVRSPRLPAAVLAGGFWGGCLYLFWFAGPISAIDAIVSAVGLAARATHPPAHVIPPSAWSLALMIVIPAVYVGLAARPARCDTDGRKRAGPWVVSATIDSNILLLALGWTLIEAVLHLHNHLVPQDGLLTGSHADASQFHWLARLLGFICMAFLVACANASLVCILSGARLRFLLASRSSPAAPNAVGWLPSRAVLVLQSWTLRHAQVRAPPVQVVDSSWNLVRSA